MADKVTPEVRSWMMSGIRGKNTKPELLIRKALHAAGYRFRIHRKDLPGKPDIVLPKYQAVIFVHGCFWHGHGCQLFRLPQSNTDFWSKKIAANQSNDRLTKDQLIEKGWRVMTIWECATKGKGRLPVVDIVNLLTDWLLSSSLEHEIKGGNATFSTSIANAGQRLPDYLP